MIPCVRSFAVAALLVCTSATLARGQAPAASQPPTPTFTSSVTETVDVAAHAVTTEHVGRSDIDARRARTLDEALTFLPGVRVRSGGDGRPVIDVHGLRPRHVLLLLDGVPLNATNDGQFDASLIPTEFLQDVTVTFGASSVLYGDGGMGGVIELTPIVPAKGLQAGAGADWRSADQRDVSGRVMKGTDRASILASARAFTADGFPLPGAAPATSLEDRGLRNNTDSSGNMLMGKLSLALTDHWRVATLVTMSSGEYGVPPTAIDNPADRFAQRPRFERVEQYRTQASQFSWDYKSQKRLSVRGWGFANQERQHRLRYDGPSYDSIANETVPGTFDTNDVSTVSGGALHARYNLGRLGELKAAFNDRYEQFASNGVIRDVDRASPSAPSAAGTGGGQGGRAPGGVPGADRFYDLRAIDSEHSANVMSGGVEWEGRPRAGTGLVAGYALNVQHSPASPPHPATPTVLAGFVEQWRGGITVHGAAFRRARFPSIGDLYDTGSGNPDLQPERSRGVEGGIDRRVGRGYTAVNAYLMDTRDFIERSDDTTRYVNRDRYTIRGVDTSLMTPITARVDVRGMYSFLNAVDRSSGSERSQLQYQPRHRISMDTRWSVTSSVRSRLAVAWTGSERYYSRSAPIASGTTRPYTLCDLAVTKSLDRLSLTVGMNNAFDVYRESPYGMPQSGRTLYISLRAQALH
jgi:outer membrane cobalamin receptor